MQGLDSEELARGEVCRLAKQKQQIAEESGDKQLAGTKDSSEQLRTTRDNKKERRNNKV